MSAPAGVSDSVSSAASACAKILRASSSDSPSQHALPWLALPAGARK